MSDLMTYHQKNNFIDLDFPVFLSESSIVYNKSTGENRLVNVFGNIGDTVNVIHIEITSLNVFDEKIGTKSYTYENADFKGKSYFGKEVSIPIPSETRKVEVNIVKVISADGTILESKKEDTVTLGTQEEIKDYPEEFLHGIEKDNNIKCKYYPQNYENAWQCSCGIANSKERETCRSCGAKRETVETICADEYLDGEYAEYKKQKKIEKEEETQREIEEEEERRKEEEQAKKKKKRTTTIIVCIVAALVICVGVFLGIYFGTQNLRQYNNKAEKFIEQEQYEEAYEILYDLAEMDYKNSKETMKEISQYINIQFLINYLKPGDTVYFGTYEQDNDESNGREPVEWIVLERLNKYTVKLLSIYCIDTYSYTSNNISTMNGWLNGEFMHNIFSNEEQSNIKEISFLSYDMLDSDYFSNETSGTQYACRNESEVITDCSYWLDGLFVYHNGEVVNFFSFSDRTTFYVRPLVTINVEQ